MATPGTIVSVVGHVGLLGWLLLGFGFDAEPLRLETMDVSVISGEEFDQMRARSTPDPVIDAPSEPLPPVAEEQPSLPRTAPETPPAVQTPQPVEVSPPEPQLPPVLETAVVDQLPPAPPQPDLPDSDPALPVSDTPTPPRAPLVSSTINAPPPADAAVDDVVREAAEPAEEPTTDPVPQEQEATAPEESTTQIVIEDAAPTTSVRPMARPSRPAPTPVAAEPPAPEPEAPPPAEVPTEDVNALLAELATAPAPTPVSAPQGPPMTGAEQDNFRLSVQRCWNVDTGSLASTVTVEVAFSLDRQGRVIDNRVELVSSDGDATVSDVAFRAARIAVLMCQDRGNGFDLPEDKYDQWKDVVLTFDPTSTRLR